ncbi:MAG TPA: hypothetical protein VD815_05660 [Candidatus Saccharimonadales bacterium]|nr:hypothetical protein [Candidatus Saccharimonadales bacterium]
MDTNSLRNNELVQAQILLAEPEMELLFLFTAYLSSLDVITKTANSAMRL